ncbi:hypothetical protein VTP01DRAFT_6071 [Rhizomucor pusillus]|uniref:uncharacterized protein n=1 Tax=Rhizomucor pusillus TaxID=4840 RepID=UPI0037424124
MIFAQQTALVTGATRGIGYAIADAFARNGARTILVGRDPDHVQTVERAFVERYGHGHKGVVLDVSNKEAITNTMKQILKEGSIEYLVNSAGICRDTLLVQTKEQDLMDVMNTNLFGTMWMCHAVTRNMIRKRKGGCIINVSSAVGIYGNAGQTVYGASKAGVIGFTKSLAKELGPLQIRVNAIAPGYIETDMTANMLQSPETKENLLKKISLQRFGKVEDVAEAALFLARSQYMHGQVLMIDGGLVL